MASKSGEQTYDLIVEHVVSASAEKVYRAWTEGMGEWFASPESVKMRAIVGDPFYFETYFDGQRHPHYGRFIELVPGERIVMTWVTGDPGTRGAETVITLSFTPVKEGTQVSLTHSGFRDEAVRDGHKTAWPEALAMLKENIG